MGSRREISEHLIRRFDSFQLDCMPPGEGLGDFLPSRTFAELVDFYGLVSAHAYLAQIEGAKNERSFYIAATLARAAIVVLYESRAQALEISEREYLADERQVHGKPKSRNLVD